MVMTAVNWNDVPGNIWTWTYLTGSHQSCVSTQWSAASWQFTFISVYANNNFNVNNLGVSPVPQSILWKPFPLCVVHLL